MPTSVLLDSLDPGVELDSITIVHEMDHLFGLKKGTKHVCSKCGANRFHPDHGIFSYNRVGSGGNRHVYQATKKLWEQMWLTKLRALDLPRPAKFIEVFGRASFPDSALRDEDNYRFLVSKFFADALQSGGYLANDDSRSYRFRELDFLPPVSMKQRTELLLLISV